MKENERTVKYKNQGNDYPGGWGGHNWGWASRRISGTDNDNMYNIKDNIFITNLYPFAIVPG